MKRLRIEHQTGFRYDDTVTASYNEARMLPGTTDSQFVLAAAIDILPNAQVGSYVDYFGTRVSSFDVFTPHTELVITSRSLVEVRSRPADGAVLGFDRLATEAERTVETIEQLAQTERTTPPEEVAELAKELASRADSATAAALTIAETLTDAVTCDGCQAGVHTAPDEVWATKRGTCRDVTHLAIGALRSVGIPARYVSGYAHPRAGTDVGVALEAGSHAWLEWFTGEWRGFDVSERELTSDGHVRVGHGRDYSDVPPLRGVYAGPSSSELHVKVTITREA
ncbi:MAG: transglutaminase family protein [Microbacterium sp.]